MVEDPIIELVVPSVKVRVGEDASLHQVVGEVRSLLQMTVDVWQCVLEGSCDHDSVLFSENLVPNPASREDRLLSDSLDLFQDLPTFSS